jgi:hypothetical protein
MATETSNIDDILMGGGSKMQPETPEYTPEIESDDSSTDYEEKPILSDDSDEPEQEEPTEKEEQDEYGNDKQKAKTYTEDEVNERINKAVRERIARQERNSQQPPTQQQTQQAAQGFEYNPDSETGWQQQLEQFVEQTVSKMSNKQYQQQQAYKEQQVQAEFEERFQTNMTKFADFKDVVGAQPITDPMTLSLRAMKDPAAFIYAASKRNAPELLRISQIVDPYTQMVEMGRLEERMRKSSTGTSAPKPVGRSRDDSVTHIKDGKKESSIEDLIAKSESKKLAKLKQFRGDRR